MFEETARAGDGIWVSPLVEPCHALKIEIHEIRVWRPLRASSLIGDQLGAQLAGQTGDDLVLQIEQIGERFVETLRQR